MKQNKLVLINETLRRKKTTLYKTETQVVSKILLKYQIVTQISNSISNIKRLLLKYQIATQISNSYSNIKQLLKYQTATQSLNS